MIDTSKLQSYRFRIVVVLCFAAIFQIAYILDGDLFEPFSLFKPETTASNEYQPKSIKNKNNVVKNTYKGGTGGAKKNNKNNNNKTVTTWGKKKMNTTYNAFNQTNPFKDTWCPTATCFNSPTCTPCDHRYLFLISTARSGSTTLLKMFNNLPNVRLSGENYNALYEASKLATFFDRGRNRKFFQKKKDINEGKFVHGKVEEGPFMHNGIPLGSMGCVMQSFMSYMNPPDMTYKALPLFNANDEAKIITGTKVIHVQNGNWTPNEAGQFFKENFPCARFIINIRSNTENQLHSMSDAFDWDKKNQSGHDELLKAKEDDVLRQNAFLTSLHEVMGEKSSQLIDMSQWKDDVGVLNKVVDWMGFENCAFNSLVHENHDRYEHDTTTEIHLGDNCRIL